MAVGSLLALLISYSITSLVKADVEIFAKWTVNDHFYNVQSFYNQGDYYILYENEPDTDNNMFTLGFYSLNGTNATLNNMTIPRYKREIKTSLRFSVDYDSTPNIKATIMVCSSADCDVFGVAQEASGGAYSAVPINTQSSWCTSGILSTDSLLAFNGTDTSLTSIVIQRGSNMMGFTCANRVGYKLVCSSSTGTLTDIRTVETRVTQKDVWIFSIQANTESTALCTHKVTHAQTSTTQTFNAEHVLDLRVSTSSLAVTAAGDDFLAYVSTSIGVVSKIYVSEDGVWDISTYSVTPPMDGTLFPVMTLENDKLLLHSKTQMVILDVQEACTDHKDFCSCLAPKDPRCGWCLNYNACTSNDACDSDSIPLWFKADPRSETDCLNNTVSPKTVSRANPELFDIQFHDTSDSELFSGSARRYKCLYSNISSSSTVLSVTPQAIRCQPPNITQVNQAYPAGESIDIPLFVWNTNKLEIIPMLATYKMVICSDIDNCGECTNSHSSCSWCINDHKCATVQSVDSQCPNSLETNHQAQFGSGQSCPSVTTSEVKVPVDTDYKLELPVTNFPTTASLSYTCEVNDGKTTVELTATKSGDKVICGDHQFGASTNSETFLLDEFNVTVKAGDWTFGSVSGEVYDCSFKSACTQCVLVDQSGLTDCVWCPSSGCVFNSCASGDNPISSVPNCPTLVIHENKIKPRNIPIEGQLVLDIPGVGLNERGAYETAEILVGNENCTNITASQGDSSDDILHCILPSKSQSGSVTLKVTVNGISWENSAGSDLRYYNPSFSGITVQGASNVRYGPVAGGTDLQISGDDLEYLESETEWRIDFVSLRNKRASDTAEVVHQLSSCSFVRGGGIKCETPTVQSEEEYSIRLTFTDKDYVREMTSPTFKYKPNSVVDRLTPDNVVAWGGRNFTVYGSNFDSVYAPSVRFTGLADSSYGVKRCRSLKPSSMVCDYPEFSLSESGTPAVYDVILLFDGVPISQNTLDVNVLPNPYFQNFSNVTKARDSQLIIDAEHIEKLGKDDIEVKVGGKICEITKIEAATVICNPPELTPKEQSKSTVVTVEIYGRQRFILGKLDYSVAGSKPLSPEVIGGIAASGAVLVIIAIVIVLLVVRRSRYHKQQYRSMVKHVHQLESNSRAEIKAAFAELQTDMSDLITEINTTGIPYWDYKNFTFKILFPGETDHPTLHKLMVAKKKTYVVRGLDMFEHLLSDKHFLVNFVHTLESQPDFAMRDRVNLAALLMLTFQHKMGYITEIIKELLESLIKTTMEKKHPKLLLRRSESVVEKMLTHWLSLSLYKYLQDHAGKPLFMLYQAIKHQIEKGPVDALSGEARYSLSQERLLRLTVDAKPVNLDVTTDSGEKIQCRVLDCDTPTQVKEKILDMIYKNQAYSIRPLASDFHLEWCPDNNVIHGVPLCDEDITSKTENGWKRLNMLSHYLIRDNTRMRLISRYHTQSLHSNRSRDTDKLCDTLSTSNRGTPRGTPRGTLTKNGALSMGNLQDHYTPSHISLWHLSKSAASQTLPRDRQQTMMSEIFLTRLLKTKGTLQEFIDILFTTIFSAQNLPPTIKILFDFLDEQANRHNVSDPEVVHVWKNNSLNLRFWVNIIKNPEFVFDINKSEIVDASLSTIAQTFIDSCAMTESDFGQDAPINKLLFAKDRPRYRKLLQDMYTEIRCTPQHSQKQIEAYHRELSEAYPRDFYRNSALKDIYLFAQKYQTQLIDTLERNALTAHNTTLFRDIINMLQNVDLRTYERYESNGVTV